MAERILKGRKVAKGKASGEALVSHDAISFVGGVDIATGVIVEKENDISGASIAGKILVFPTEKGSTAGSFMLSEMALNKVQPAGIINLRANPVLAVGAIIGNIPMVDRLDGNPVDIIKTGDYVEMDADTGIVKVKSKS